MDENRRPSTHAVTVQTAMAHSSTATAAQSGSITTIKQEDGVSFHIKPEHDSFSLSDLPPFIREENGMEVIYEDGHLEEEDADVQEEGIVVTKFGSHHGSSHANRFEPNRSRTITKRKPDFQEDEPGTKSDSDSDSDSDSAFESMSLGTRKRQKTETGRANTTASTTTTTGMRPETTMVLSTKQVITQIFSSSSPRAHSDIHTYPLPPDQPHRHSYHSPLLLSFPSNSKSCSTENSTAAARKHRDALLAWFDTYSAARQMPWRKAWVDASPLLYPASGIPSSSIAINTTSAPAPASASASKPAASSVQPTSDSLVGPKVKASPPIPESALLFPNLAASILRAQAEAEAQKRQAQAEAEARARAHAQAKVKAEAEAKSQKQAQTLQSLRSTIAQRFYETLLSEILRQIFRETDQEEAIKNITTQYDRWIKAFPTIEDLAKANEEQVEELSDDIRATRLHRAARQICEGKSYKSIEIIRLPTTVEKLQNLSGVGPHTAGVVAAVVFGRAEPMVIWDVTRVLARQLGIRADANKNAAREVIWEAARRLVEQVAWDGVEAEEEAKAKRIGKSKKGTRKDMNEGENVVDLDDRRNRGPPPLSDRPGRWGQALMELGAAVCLAAPKTPLCHLCPIQATCRAYAEGLEIAREEGMVVGNKATRKEQDRQALKKKVDKLQKQKVVDIEDAACSLCPPLSLSPPIFPSASHSSNYTSATKIKKENQDEIWQPGEYLEDTDRDTEVHYLGTVPKSALPSTKENTGTHNMQTTQDTQQQTNNKDAKTIWTTFYEQNSWLRLPINLERSKPIPDYLCSTTRKFITAYCAQYPYNAYTKAKPEGKTTTASGPPKNIDLSMFRYQT
ncbi:DNA glycosylase [Neurospora crassa]|uniref:A/G-specific adenine glycosylase n=1 Tax=Neurospora crassa (strain ATCC 24698 / 74-OR23-1A / CBS 708.71 / DSM 1257 / FGSC 987) TaxID=367110 RepID=A7UW17_NEUCR|nr:A/G-specific adenine glycosylase [Neurospora crassa OR74A]EDO65358.2 A/G-specific adenine glycosylase [Neurospora crassa OR74A]KHE83808.1 DNA glycosylase [Neurospora crassa]|eukprot:XP_001728449.2 A/G-specific adenine glycosylase [Neurospora crassa OR74A]